MSLPWISLALSIVSLLCTGCALLAVGRLALKKNACDHAEVIQTINREVRALDADIDDVFDRMKRLTARKGMRERRDQAEATGAQRVGESPAEWKARMRKSRNGVKHDEGEV